MPIDHFVVVMMENRSFDHYFGWLGETGLVDGLQQATYLDPQGNPVETRHASSMGAAEWQGCGHPDPGPRLGLGRAQLKDGFMADGSGNDEFALTYYDEGELGFIHGAANAYTVYDRWFCSQLGPTWPNRYYKWSGQSGGKNNNSVPADTLGNQWETIFDVALRSDVTARYYNSDLPFSATFGARGASWTRPLAEYYADAALGLLPNITFVDPPFRDGGGFDGNSADEHPHGDVRLGQAWMADVVKAFVESPNYERGALFVIYDEWGGFFDHVKPPSVPDDRQSANLDEDFGQMGFRIPAVAISPYTRNRSERPCPGRPRPVRHRIDPEADHVPLRARLRPHARGCRPDAGGQREQRRRELQLEEAGLRAARPAGARAHRVEAVRVRRRRRARLGERDRARVRPRRSRGAGAPVRDRRPATASRTSCSASRTRCARRCAPPASASRRSPASS